MIESTYTSVESFRERQRIRRNQIFGLMLAALVVVFGIVGAASYLAPKTPPLLLGMAGLVIFSTFWIPGYVWHEPRRGFYILFTGAMIFEAVTVTYLPVNVPTSVAPFWLNFSTCGQALLHTNALNPIKFSFAEVLMVWTVLCWLIRSISNREFTFRKGAFMGWLMAYTGCVLFGFFNGLAHGADKTIALWEIRPWFHYLTAYILAANLITDRKQLIPLLWITIFGNAFKALVGIYDLAQMHFSPTDQGVLSHEESLFFNLIVFIVFITWMTNLDKKITRVAMWLLPLVLFADMENNRRASFAAFVIAFIPLLIILWVSLPERRKLLATCIISLTLGFILYLPIAWNSTAAWALPARAIRSQITPDERDASSDAYRLSESTDLRATRDSSPWIGYGYGRKFLQPVPLMDLGTDFLSYMPHNSVLWVWMRLGHIGFFCFMMLLITVCVKGAGIIRDTPDPLLRTVGVLGILAMLMLYIYGKVDLQLICYRTMVMTAIFVGVLSILPELHEKEQRRLADEARAKVAEEALYVEPTTAF